MTMFDLDRRHDIGQRLHAALASNGGQVVMRDVFPNFNDRKLAHRIADDDPTLQYICLGRPRPAVISVISTNGEQPQPE